MRPEKQSNCQEKPFTAAIRLFQATVEGHIFRKAGIDPSISGQQDLQTGQIVFSVAQI